MQECCRTGFRWEGDPVGHEITLADRPTYVTGNNSERAILYCHDAFGWTLNNNRLLADHFAQEVGATVYIPDFFHGDGVHPDNLGMVRDGETFRLERSLDVDWKGWFERNDVNVRLSEVLACARQLRQQYSMLGVVGYCWGGSTGFKLASKEHEGMFDCVSVVHPGSPTDEDVKSISVPFQFLMPQHDPMAPERVDFCNREISKLGIDYQYQYFPDVPHGFAIRCNMSQPREKKALELAKNAVVYWMVSHLG